MSGPELNMRSASLDRIIKFIRFQVEHDDYTPVTILGKAGIGKTESMLALAKEMGWGIKELRLSHYQESDFVGMPYIEQPTNMTRHAPTDLFPPSDDTGKGILLLDEVTSANRSLRSAVYQLMDESRKLGQYRLPEKWIVVACGNGENDGGDYKGMESAFLSRGFSWRVEPNASEWRSWALKNGVNPSVIAFIAFQPDKIHDMGTDDSDREGVIACPRSWTKLGKLLDNMEKTPNGERRIIEDDEDLEFVAAGCVGANCGAMFTSFYRYNKQVISAQDIVDGVNIDDSALRNMSTEVLYLTSQGVTHLLMQEFNNNRDDSNTANSHDVSEKSLTKLANVFRFLIRLEQVSVTTGFDAAVTVIREMNDALGSTFSRALTSERFDEVCPEFLEWAASHKDIIDLLN